MLQSKIRSIVLPIAAVDGKFMQPADQFIEFLFYVLRLERNNNSIFGSPFTSYWMHTFYLNSCIYTIIIRGRILSFWVLLLTLLNTDTKTPFLNVESHWIYSIGENIKQVKYSIITYILNGSRQKEMVSQLDQDGYHEQYFSD